MRSWQGFVGPGGGLYGLCCAGEEDLEVEITYHNAGEVKVSPSCTLCQSGLTEEAVDGEGMVRPVTEEPKTDDSGMHDFTRDFCC